MDTIIDYRKTGIGEAFDFWKLRETARAVFGGVSWPSKRPGFAVVVAMAKKPHLNGHDIYLLDEYESFDTRLLVEQIGAMDAKFGIMRDQGINPDSLDKWIGDDMNDAADKFIDAMNAHHEKTNCPITLDPTIIQGMENAYSYLLPQIKDMLNAERRMLFLKDSKIIDYLGEVEEIDIAEFKIGEYPAIEALGFAVIEMRDQVKKFEESLRRPQRKYSNNFDPLNAGKL